MSIKKIFAVIHWLLYLSILIFILFFKGTETISQYNSEWKILPLYLYGIHNNSFKFNSIQCNKTREVDFICSNTISDTNITSEYKCLINSNASYISMKSMSGINCSYKSVAVLSLGKPFDETDNSNMYKFDSKYEYAIHMSCDKQFGKDYKYLITAYVAETSYHVLGLSIVTDDYCSITDIVNVIDYKDIIYFAVLLSCISIELIIKLFQKCIRNKYKVWRKTIQDNENEKLINEGKDELIYFIRDNRHKTI